MKKDCVQCFFGLFSRRARDAESLENIAMRSSDSAPSTPEDNINVVVRLVYKLIILSNSFKHNSIYRKHNYNYNYCYPI